MYSVLQNINRGFKQTQKPRKCYFNNERTSWNLSWCKIQLKHFFLIIIFSQRTPSALSRCLKIRKENPSTETLISDAWLKQTSTEAFCEQSSLFSNFDRLISPEWIRVVNSLPPQWGIIVGKFAVKNIWLGVGLDLDTLFDILWLFLKRSPRELPPRRPWPAATTSQKSNKFSDFLSIKKIALARHICSLVLEEALDVHQGDTLGVWQQPCFLFCQFNHN